MRRWTRKISAVRTANTPGKDEAIKRFNRQPFTGGSMTAEDLVYGSSVPRIRATDLAAYWAAENADELEGRVFDTKRDALSGYLPRLGGRKDDFYDGIGRRQERKIRLSTVLHNLAVHMESSEEELQSMDKDGIVEFAEDVVWNYEPVLDVNNELGVLREKFGTGREEVLEEIGEDLEEYASRKSRELSDREPVKRIAEYSPENSFVGARIDLLEPENDHVIELKNSRGAGDRFQAATYAFCRDLETGREHTAEVRYIPVMNFVPTDMANAEILGALNSMRRDIDELRTSVSMRTRERLDELGMEYEERGSPEETVKTAEGLDSGEAAELLEEVGEQALDDVLEA